MQNGRVFYSILHVMAVTAIAAIGFNTLLNESPWWRATLTTLTLGLVLNSLIRCAVCRGAKQAYAIGFAVSSFFYLLSLYTLAGLETLPLLITQHAHVYLAQHTASPPSEEHFFLVAIIIWGLACAYAGGLAARHWHARRVKEALLT